MVGWTIQSTGKALCSYCSQKRAEFFEALVQVAYTTLDVWESVEKRCPIAFDTKPSPDVY